MRKKSFAVFLWNCLFILLIVTACKFNSSDKTIKQVPPRDTTGLLSVEAMQSDLIVLWKAIEEVHPGFGIYVTPDSLLRKYEEVSAAIRKPLSEDDFIATIYPFLSALGCGHTQFQHSAVYKKDTSKPEVFLPFEILVHDQRAWITNVMTDKLKTGDELLSINDLAVSSIIKEGSALYSGDGYIPSFKELFLFEYGGFKDVLARHGQTVFPYNIVYRSKSGKVDTVTVNRSDIAKTWYTPPVQKPENWELVLEAGVRNLYWDKKRSAALLEAKHFEYDDTLLYKFCFDFIDKWQIKNLVLDMRHNGGGDLRIAINLMSYLMNEDFGIIKDLWARIPDPSKSKSAIYFDSSLTENFKRSCVPVNNAGGLHHMNASAEFGQVFYPIHPAVNRKFNGKLIVLIDGATFSSAALFVAALKAQHKNVVFVGRETAGTEEGCNGFSMQRLTLPATAIVVQFPWLRVVSMAKQAQHGRGLMPDYPVEYSPFDISKSIDTDLKKAESLIR